jgi:hypothetical protein
MTGKQHILAEIKRMAAANGGEPPGWRRFHNETGIRATEWLRYWPRWGDAVRDAGYTANDKQGAYTSENLIEKYIAFARELGRLPTAAEIHIKSLNDGTFPGEKTIRNRFGPKRAIAEAVAKFCESHAGYDDVRAWCLAYESKKKADGDAENESEEQIGFVYLLKSGRYYKIGKSNAAGRRERELQIQLPERANTVHVIRTDDPAGIEKYWHGRFEAKRKNGEWFELSASDVTAFRRRKFM